MPFRPRPRWIRRLFRTEIPFSRGTLFGWLLEPSEAEASATVIVIGGADGWREAYYTGAAYLLERGLSVLLLDGPGQGETRLFGGVNLDIDFAAACSAALEHLPDERGKQQIGIWGATAWVVTWRLWLPPGMPGFRPAA